METWTEIRCPACVGLGWYSSHLLLKVTGNLVPLPVSLEMKCPRCKSKISWHYGTPEFSIVSTGKKKMEFDRYA